MLWGWDNENILMIILILIALSQLMWNSIIKRQYNLKSNYLGPSWNLA